MSREVRRVPKDWIHPEGIYLLPYDFKDQLEKWEEGELKWNAGFVRDWSKDEVVWKEKPAGWDGTYEEHEGERPREKQFMPTWPEEEKTHYQMYETTTEGSPISPVMKNPEQLAQWLVEANASAFGSQTASYEGWLRVANGGFAVSCVKKGGSGRIVSGVEALKEEPDEA